MSVYIPILLMIKDVNNDSDIIKEIITILYMSVTSLEEE